MCNDNNTVHKMRKVNKKNLYLWRWWQIATLNHLLGRRRRPTEDTPSTTTPDVTHSVIWAVHGWLKTRLKRQRNDFFAMSSPPWCNFCTCFLLQKRKRRKLVRKTRLARMDGSFNIDATTISRFYFKFSIDLGFPLLLLAMVEIFLPLLDILHVPIDRVKIDFRYYFTTILTFLSRAVLPMNLLEKSIWSHSPPRETLWWIH